MPIPLACDSCGRRVKVKDEYAGRRIRCPGCQEPIAVPAVADDFDLDYVDYEEEEFDERPSSPKTRRQKATSRQKRSRRKSRAETGWFRRHWHWVAVLVMMLFALWPRQGLVICGLFAAGGVVMVFIGGLFPFVRVVFGAPGTVLLLLLSQSARFDMMRQPDNHPYKVLCRTAFDPTRGMFWKGVLLTVMIVPAALINNAVPELFKSRAAEPDPPFAGPNHPDLIRPGQRPVGGPAPHQNEGWPGFPRQGNLSAGGGNPPQGGFPPQRPAQFSTPGDRPEVFTYTITYESFTGEGSVQEVALSALRINPGFPEDSLQVDEEAKTIDFQYKVRIAPEALGRLLGSRGFRGVTVQRSGE